MKKILLFSFLFFVFQFDVDAQDNPGDPTGCWPPPVPVELFSQSAIDSFNINYPGDGCIGYVHISGEDITNLDSLYKITEIYGDLYIGYVSSNNDDGSGNPGGPGGPGACFPPPCIYNPNLADITGINNLTYITGNIFIYGNSLLTDINVLNDIDVESIDELIIVNNPELSTCNLQFVCQYLASENYNVTISDNATGCNSVEEVATSCGIVSIEEIIKSSISIYPNPASDIITVSAENINILQINIYNQLGQQMPIKPGTMIDVSTFPKGLYIVVVETDDEVFREKIMVE